MEQFLANIGSYLHSNPSLALVAAFFGGLLTAANPCVLAMIPLMMGFVAGRQDKKTSAWRALGFSAVFVLGLSITFTLLGVVAALAGTLYGDVSGVWNWIVAVVCVVMGLHLMGVLDFSIPTPLSKQPNLTGVVGALVMGLLFGFVSAPCAGGVLLVLLAYLAGSGASVAYGATLLLVYALGHSVLILIAGTSMGLAKKIIESRNLTRATDIMRRLAGVVIVVVGAYFVYQALS